jgi:hypothetical protein
VPVKIFRIELESKVSVNVINDHKKKEKSQVINGNRQGKQEYNKNPKFKKRFQWMEGVCSPGTWIGRTVVKQMDSLEQKGMVNKAMHPVKIGVMHEKHKYKSKYKIAFAVKA